MIDEFSALYAEFGRSVGVPGLKIDAYGNALLDIDGVRLHILNMREVGGACSPRDRRHCRPMRSRRC
jgi:hypothetical protein